MRTRGCSQYTESLQCWESGDLRIVEIKELENDVRLT